MTTLSGENYKITHYLDDNLITIDGTLRLRGLDEYSDISNLLNTCLDKSDSITVDLSKLEFLNSSGIAMLSRFAITARKKENITLIIKGSNDIPWQSKSLKNLQRLMPKIVLTFE